MAGIDIYQVISTGNLPKLKEFLETSNLPNNVLDLVVSYVLHKGIPVEILKLVLESRDWTGKCSDEHFLDACLESPSRLDVVKLLLEHNTTKSNLESPFILSARFGFTDITKILLDYGADIHASDDDAIQWTFGQDQLETGKLLFDYGAHMKYEEPPVKEDWESEEEEEEFVKQFKAYIPVNPRRVAGLREKTLSSGKIDEFGEN